MKKTIVILALAALLGLGGIYARSSGRGTAKSTQQQKSKIDRKEESRKVFTGLGNQGDRRLTESASKAKGDIKTVREIGLYTIDPFAPPYNLHNFLARRGCDADAIIIATVKSEASFITEDETFLYTNYKIKVEEVVKDNADSPINTNAAVTVAREGGAITLNGKKVIAESKYALPFEATKRYLLFLSYLPERNTYVADNISYLLENDKIIKTTSAKLPKEEESGNSATAFIQSVRDAVAEPCLNTQV